MPTAALKPAFAAAAFLWGLAEATFFFIVPDVLLSFIAVRYGLRPALLAAVFAVIGACLGGALMWHLGRLAPDWTANAVDVLPAISPAMIAAAGPALADDLFGTLLRGAFSGVPYKVFAFQAPGAGIGWFAFLIASVPARAARFVAVALVTAGANRIAALGVRPRGRLGILAGVWLLFYAAFWSMTPG